MRDKGSARPTNPWLSNISIKIPPATSGTDMLISKRLDAAFHTVSPRPGPCGWNQLLL